MVREVIFESFLYLNFLIFLFKIHNKKNRQPVILNAEQVNEWLDNGLKEEGIANLLKAHFDEDQLNLHTVSTDLFHPKVNSDVEEILDRVEYGELEI